VRDPLTAFPRLGPTGANIFCREAQLVWPELRPALDRKVLDGARRLGLPTTAKELAALIPDDRLAVTAAALVRVALDKDLARPGPDAGLTRSVHTAARACTAHAVCTTRIRCARRS
jgi:hypothetical protein